MWFGKDAKPARVAESGAGDRLHDYLPLCPHSMPPMQYLLYVHRFLRAKPVHNGPRLLASLASVHQDTLAHEIYRPTQSLSHLPFPHYPPVPRRRHLG